MSDLSSRHCVSCEGGVPKLAPERVRVLLGEVVGWTLTEGDTALSRTFSFRDYWQTMAFVNAIAWIAHSEDHHPDLSVHYNRCVVRWNTHAVGGLTENDFICAAKVDELLNRI